MWLRVAPQAIHDQSSQYHGQVGSANADLAAEEERWQPPGSAVAHGQTGALLRGRRQRKETALKQEENESQRDSTRLQDGF